LLTQIPLAAVTRLQNPSPCSAGDEDAWHADDGRQRRYRRI